MVRETESRSAPCRMGLPHRCIHDRNTIRLIFSCIPVRRIENVRRACVRVIVNDFSIVFHMYQNVPNTRNRWSFQALIQLRIRNKILTPRTRTIQCLETWCAVGITVLLDVIDLTVPEMCVAVNTNKMFGVPQLTTCLNRTHVRHQGFKASGTCVFCVLVYETASTPTFAVA